MSSFKHCFVAIAILVCALMMALAQTDESENVQISSKCSDDHFPCDPYVCPCNTVIFKCIPRSWTCDGAFDCADRTDDPPNCTPPSGATAGGRKKRTVQGPEPGRPKAGEEVLNVPCSETCTNGGHTPTCCRDHKQSGGRCIDGQAFCIA